MAAASFLADLRTQNPEKLLQEIIDVEVTKHMERFAPWYRGMKAELGISRESTRDSSQIPGLFGVKTSTSWPNVTRSISTQHRDFHCELLQLDFGSKGSLRESDDVGVAGHMQTMLEDGGPSLNRPMQVYIAKEITKDIISISQRGLKQQRGGKRVKAIFLLALQLFHETKGEVVINDAVVKLKWVFGPICVQNVGQMENNLRRNVVLKECADDLAFTKMTSIEAYFCIVLPTAREKYGEKPSVENLSATWKEYTEKNPKVARSICNSRDMKEFIERTTQSVKELLYKEFLWNGNDAVLTGSLFTHNVAWNLLAGKGNKNGHDASTQMLFCSRAMRMAEIGKSFTLRTSRSLSEGAIAYGRCLVELQEVATSRGIAVSDQDWERLFNQGELDTLLAKLHAKLGAAKPFKVADVVNQEIMEYERNNRKGVQPIFGLLAERGRDHEMLKKEEEDHQKDLKDHFEEKERHKAEVKAHEEAEAARMILAAQQRKEMEEAERMALDVYREKFEHAQKTNAKMTEDHQRDCNDILEGAKQKFFEESVVVGLAAPSSDRTSEGFDHKLASVLGSSGPKVLCVVVDGRVACGGTAFVENSAFEKRLDQLHKLVAIGKDSFCLYVMASPGHGCAAELAAVLKNFDDKGLLCTLLHGFYVDGVTVETAVFAIKPSAPTEVAISTCIQNAFVRNRLQVLNLVEIAATEKLVSCEGDVDKRNFKPMVLGERTPQYWMQVLEAGEFHGIGVKDKILVIECNGDAGALTTASMELGICCAASIRKPSAMSPTMERLQGRYSNLVKINKGMVELPPCPALVDMPQVPEFMQRASKKVLQRMISDATLTAPELQGLDIGEDAMKPAETEGVNSALAEFATDVPDALAELGGEPAKDDSATTALLVGNVATIKGLVSRPELDGVPVLLESLDSTSGRWICLVKGGEKMNILPQKLVPVFEDVLFNIGNFAQILNFFHL